LSVETKTKRAYTKKVQSVTVKAIPENKVVTDVESCRSCRFIRNHVCKRFPPMIGATAFIQPMVSDTDWCGCFEKAVK